MNISDVTIVKSSPILTTLSSAGNQKFWQAHIACGDKKNGYWYTATTYWQVRITNSREKATKIQWSEPYHIFPKNVGRSNNTTAKEQALFEMESMVQHQRDKGYSEPGTVSKVLPRPMLAQTFSNHGHKLKYPVYVQPKFNGQRMLFDGKKGWSRGGKIILPNVIKHLVFNTHGHILDGELLMPGNKLLQISMRAIKKHRSGISDKLHYMVYDGVDADRPFLTRYSMVKSLLGSALPNVILSPTEIAYNKADVMRKHKEFVRQGYEGTIIRDDSAGYECDRRAEQLQKHKDFKDKEFRIVGIKDGGGKFKGCAIFVCETKIGNRFNCVPEGSMPYRKELYRTRNQHNQYFGKWLTVKYQELSEDGIPLFPVGITIREKGDF